jgi:hypothetical protein
MLKEARNAKSENAKLFAHPSRARSPPLMESILKAKCSKNIAIIIKPGSNQFN